jgi:hypothetical protein
MIKGWRADAITEWKKLKQKCNTGKDADERKANKKNGPKDQTRKGQKVNN